MNYQTFPTYAELSRAAARIIADVLRAKPDCVLGLATGSSPIGTYDELARMHREEGLTFARCTTVNLDEYRGLAGTHPQSYRYFMNDHLFSRVDVRIDHTFVPNGTAADPAAECAAYDARIKALGGTDIQLLGIGPDGHIGFNEPADAFSDGSFKVKLKDSTIEANSIYFDENPMPRYALTMGIGTIMKARKIVLIATGEKKAQAIRTAIKGEVTPQCPVSVLQNHPDALLLLDEAAASLL